MLKEENNEHHNLTLLLKGNKKAKMANHNAIDANNLKLKNSWKRIFLSGGKFDGIKTILSKLGLKKIAYRIFYWKRG